MNLLARFQHFVRHELDIAGSERILVAVSAGIDSMALLNLFRKLGQPVGVAHCNFGLRGPESDADEAFLAGYCDRAGIPFFSRRFRTAALARTNKKGIQETARDLRYAWFSELKSQHGFDRIATAHHLDDNVETMLFNLSRGSGISGLHGIVPVTGDLVRPLLFASRDEIMAFAKKHAISWRPDRSNDSVKYARNRIRHEVIPVLKALNPALVQHAGMLSSHVRFVEGIYRTHVAAVEKTCVTHKGARTFISIKALTRLPHPHFYLYEFVRAFGFNAAQVNDMVTTLDKQGEKKFFSASHQVTRDRDHLVAEAISVPASELVIRKLPFTFDDGHFEITLTAHRQGPATYTSSTFFADASDITFPLVLRKWRAGDRFQPLGMERNKKLSDFFTDEKVGPVRKKQAWILADADERIICVIPYRIDNRFRLGEKTGRVIRITCKG